MPYADVPSAIGIEEEHLLAERASRKISSEVRDSLAWLRRTVAEIADKY